MKHSTETLTLAGPVIDRHNPPGLEPLHAAVVIAIDKAAMLLECHREGNGGAQCDCNACADAEVIERLLERLLPDTQYSRDEIVLRARRLARETDQAEYSPDAWQQYLSAKCERIDPNRPHQFTAQGRRIPAGVRAPLLRRERAAVHGAARQARPAKRRERVATAD